jgi:hypothetical protein
MTALNDVRVLFDEVIASYPEMDPYLKWNAEIVKDPTFESAICKLINVEKWRRMQ